MWGELVAVASPWQPGRLMPEDSLPWQHVVAHGPHPTFGCPKKVGLLRASSRSFKEMKAMCRIYFFGFICGRAASAAKLSVFKSSTSVSKASISASKSSGLGTETVSAAGLSWL